MAEGELQQLARSPLPKRLLRELRIGIVAVIVEPTAHCGELPKCDLVAAWHTLDVEFDWIVETELALVRQHQDGCDREGLSGAANAHIEIGCHRLARRRIADAERPYVRFAAALPDADDSAGNRGSLHGRRDRPVQRGGPLVRGTLHWHRWDERSSHCRRDKSRADARKGAHAVLLVYGPVLSCARSYGLGRL